MLLKDEFYKVAVRENMKAIETLQYLYLPIMTTLQSVQVQPGQIQWPKLNLPGMADLQHGALEAAKNVLQQEDKKEEPS